MGEVTVRLDRASKQYGGVYALREVSAEFRAGEFVALVGRSGCGKSTMLNLCGAMDFPSEGSVTVGGAETGSLDDAGLTRLRRTQIGFVFQFFQLLPTLTAVENVEMPALLAGHSDARAKALQLLDWVELGGLGARFPHQLSGGQMQRVAIARALINSPKVILADEPIGNLDSSTGALVLSLLRKTAKERATTILMATHSAESAEYCDRVVRLRDGRIEA